MEDDDPGGVFSCLKQIFEDTEKNKNASMVVDVGDDRSPMISNILSIPDSLDLDREDQKNIDQGVSMNINIKP